MWVSCPQRGAPKKQESHAMVSYKLNVLTTAIALGTGLFACYGPVLQAAGELAPARDELAGDPDAATGDVSAGGTTSSGSTGGTEPGTPGGTPPGGTAAGGTTGSTLPAAPRFGFQLATEGTPGLCVQPQVTPVVGPTPLVAMPCSEAAPQRWTWSGGTFRQVDGGACLARQGTEDNAPIVVTTCASGTQTWSMDASSVLYVNVAAGSLVLSPATTPVVAGTPFVVKLFTGVTPAVRWRWLRPEIPPKDGQGSLPGGFTISPTNAPTGCLTNAGGPEPRVQSCLPGTPNQRWTLELGQLKSGDTCLIRDGLGGVFLSPCDEERPSTQTWHLGAGGDMVANFAAPIQAVYNNNGFVQLAPNGTPDHGWVFGDRL
jgi:hypothetical protein